MLRHLLEFLDQRDVSGRFALDELLRKHGFRIHDRPRRSEPSWVRGHLIYEQSDALTLVPWAEKSDAELAELMHWELNYGG